MTTLTVELTAMAHGGSALGRAADKVVFVPYALPGEVVEARVVDDHGRWANADLVRVLQASPDRVEPRCPHFGPPDTPPVEREDGALLRRGCGGCQWQHIDYATQLRLKQAVVRDQLARVGKLPDVEVRPTIGMAEPWDYRNHVQMHTADDGALGFRTLRGHAVVPIWECHIMAPAVGELWQSLDLDFPELRQVILRGDMGVDDQLILITTDFDELPDLEVDFPVSVNLELRDGQVVNLIGAPWLGAHVAGRDFRVSATAFFQVNTPMAETLVQLVREALRPVGGESLVDLYAGVGLFGLTLADSVGQVIAVEAHPTAVEDWRANAADLDNVRIIAGPVETALAEVRGPIHLAVVDPPRTGMAPEALDALVALQPMRVAYVSCDPATLARDAARLVNQGYRPAYVQPVDMFPQTWHIECVALFERGEGRFSHGRQARPDPARPSRRGGRRAGRSDRENRR